MSTAQQSLHGRWRPEAAQVGGEAPFTEIEIRPDGKLRFSVQQLPGEDATLLEYRVEDGWILTRAPDEGAPELRTRFDLQPDGSLLLEYAGHRARYVRA